MNSSQYPTKSHVRTGQKRTRSMIIALFSVLALGALGLVLESNPAEGNEGVVGTYSRGRFSVTIPYRAE